MTTITIKEKTKAGKTLLEIARMLAVISNGIVVDKLASKKEKSYNAEFVDKILKSDKNDRRFRIYTSDLWDNI